MIVPGRLSASDRPATQPSTRCGPATRPSTHAHDALLSPPVPVYVIPHSAFFSEHPPHSLFSRRSLHLLSSPRRSPSRWSCRRRETTMLTRLQAHSVPLRCPRSLLPYLPRATAPSTDPHCPCNPAPCTPPEMRMTAAAPTR